MPFDDMVDTIIRRPSSSWAGGYIVTVMFGLFFIVAWVFAVALFVSGEWQAGLCASALGAWMGVLTRYVWRDASAKHGWKVGIGYDAVTLDLPAGRFLMTAAERVKAQIPYRDIDAIETRNEAWYSLGMANMQRAYALRLRNGQLIRLGEDRALGTNLADQTVGGMVDRLLLRSGLRMRDYGLVEANGGLLGLAFTSMPPWGAAGVSPERAKKAWYRAELTGLLAGLLTLLAMVALFLA